MASPAAVLSILVKAQGVQAAAGQLGALDKTGRKAGAGLATTEKQAKRTSKTFSAMGTAAKSAGLLIGGVGLVKGLKVANAEYREAQKVGAQTNAVLKSTGNAARVTKKHIEDLAGSISKKSGIDDEAIQSGANLLLTFTKIRNETGRGNKIFDQATQTITDMSVALGQSGKSSAIQLGKALNDPIKGITALRRVGVSFTAAQEKQIKGMVESGNLLGAQKRILKELTAEFGGSAAAQATAGDKLKVSLNNMAEAAGAILVPALDKVAKFLTTMINEFIEGKGVAHAMAVRFLEVGKALLPLGVSIQQIVKWLRQHNEVAKILIPTLTGLAAAVWAVNVAMRANPFVLAATALAALVVGFVTAYRESEKFRNIVNATFATLAPVVTTAVNAIVPVTTAFQGIVAAVGTVQGAFTAMVTWVRNAMAAVQVEIGKWKVAGAVLTAVIAVVKVNIGILVAVMRAGLALIAPLFTAMFGVLKAIVTGAFNAIKAIVQGGLQAIRGVIQVFGGIFKGDFGQIWEGIKNIFRGVGIAIAGILRASLGTVRDAGIALGKGIIGGLKSALNLAHELAVAMRDLISKAPGYALGVGKAIVSGIIDGIKAAAGGIGNALKGAVKGATPDFLGIGDGIGKSIGAGSIVPVKGGGSLMGARPIMSRFAAVGAANGLHVSSGLRRGAITSSGNQSYHSTGEAVDLAGSPAGMMKTFKTLRSRFGSQLAELIYTPGGAGIKNGRPNVYTGQVAADHFDHVHVAFDSGKPGLGDGVGRARSAAAVALGDGPGKLGGTQLANLWVRAGGDPKLAGLMARIAMAESGGDPTARNKSGATGLWQILGAMVKGNLINPLVNARNAVAKYKAQGLGAWAASRGSWGKYVGHPGISAGKDAAKAKAAAKINPYDLAIAQSDVAIAGAATHKIGGVGGRTVSKDLVKYAAILQKEKILGARIRKIRGALKGKLTGSTRLRLTQELAQLIPEHQQLARDRSALRAPAAPADTSTDIGSTAIDAGPEGDPNQPLIDATEALTAATTAHTDAVTALQDEINKQNAIAGSTVGIGLREAQRALADMISGQLGGYGGAAGRALTAGSGSVVRY